MNWKNFKIIASFLSVLILSACDGDCTRDCDSSGKNCQRECGAGHCIDADDWGFAKVRVSAEQKDLSVRNDPILNQYADGIDSGQVLIDADNVQLVITIGKRDQWTSWFGGDINPRLANGQIDPSGFDGGRTVPDRECLYYLPDGKTSSSASTFFDDLSPTTLKVTKDFTGTTSTPRTPAVPASPGVAAVPQGPANPNKTPAALGITPDQYTDSLVPCYYRYGMGLYVGLAPDNGSLSSPDDVVLTYHIPDAKKPDYINDINQTVEQNKLDEARDGYLVRGLPKNELVGAQTGDRLYFKIVDRTYLDNSGGYTVKIKEGTRNPSPGPLEKISSVFIDPIEIAMNRLYNGIVQNAGFIKAVQAALALYVAFYGFVFLIGGIGEAKKDAIVRVIKMGLIFTLIGPNSWNFFYNTLFHVFIGQPGAAGGNSGGIQGIATLLMNPFGDYDPNDPWYSMDQVLSKFWSPETWAKIGSTLFSNYLGILFILSMLLAMGVFMVALVRALIVYLLTFGGIAVLVVIAPIFLVFMLFGKTKDLTKEWFDQLFVFALQQIILMAALGMFAAIILMYLERTIGYNVCWNVWSNFGMHDISMIQFKFWMPDISTDQAPIWIDANSDGNKVLVTRYVDLPYFDPVFDKEQIAKYSSEKNFLSFFDILILIASVYLMYNFMQIVPTIASTLKGGGALSSSDMFKFGGAMVTSLGEAGASALGGVVNTFKGIKSGARSLASNNEARYAGGKVKRGGIVAGGAVAGAAMVAGKAVANSAPVAYGAYAGRKVAEGAKATVGRGLDKMMPSRVSARAASAQRQMSSLANSRHKVETHETEATTVTRSHQDAMVTYKVGSNLANQRILEKGDVSKILDGLKDSFRKDTTQMQKLDGVFSKYSSKAEVNLLSRKSQVDQLKHAMPVFAALSDDKLSERALAGMAMKSPKEIKRMHSVLSSVLEKNADKIPEHSVKIIKTNLERLKNSASAGTAVRPGVAPAQAAGLAPDIARAFDKAMPAFTDPKITSVNRPGAAEMRARHEEASRPKPTQPQPSQSGQPAQPAAGAKAQTPPPQPQQARPSAEYTAAPVKRAEDSHYKALGVTKDATDAEVRKAYLKLSREHHPDKNFGNEENAAKRMREVNDAYNVIKESREAYNKPAAQTSPAAPKAEPKAPTPPAAPKAEKSHYDVLGIAKDASERDVKVAYMKLARTNHPDKGGDAEEFKKISAAYETLKESDTRKAYDSELKNKPAQAAPQAAQAPAKQQDPTAAAAPSAPAKAEPLLALQDAPGAAPRPPVAPQAAPSQPKQQDPAVTATSQAAQQPAAPQTAQAKAEAQAREDVRKEKEKDPAEVARQKAEADKKAAAQAEKDKLDAARALSQTQKETSQAEAEARAKDEASKAAKSEAEKKAEEARIKSLQAQIASLQAQLDATTDEALKSALRMQIASLRASLK